MLSFKKFVIFEMSVYFVFKPILSQNLFEEKLVGSIELENGRKQYIHFPKLLLSDSFQGNTLEARKKEVRGF